MTDVEKLFNSGVLTVERIETVKPPKDLWEIKRNGLVIIECPQRIPCNPCYESCPTGAILPFEDINDIPLVDYTKCIGCGRCVAKCPGLACFVADLTWGAENQALMKLPYEMLPKPEPGDDVVCLDRVGSEVSQGKVINITEPWEDSTMVVHVVVPKDRVMDIRNIKVVKNNAR